MSFSVKIIRKDEQSTSTWSGGTTTQLAIYPETSDYKARNFKWRLSTARVDIEESTFTSLPEIWRHIMIIEGKMSLQHEGHHSALLKPYEQDSFSGDWVTNSLGKARDFNLMLSQGYKGSLEAVPIGKDKNTMLVEQPYDNDFARITNAVYCSAGSVNVAIDKDKAYTLNEGDLMLVSSMKSNEHPEMVLSCISNMDSIIIRARVIGSE